MGMRPMKTRDISLNKLPSKNILNSTLVTQVEIIENGVLKYYNWDSRSKVVVMIEDTGRTLRLYINHFKNEEPCQTLVAAQEEVVH